MASDRSGAHYEAWSEAGRSGSHRAGYEQAPSAAAASRTAGHDRADRGGRFDLRRVFTERKILLVNLSKGLLGPETSALLGSLVVSQLWQAVLGRAAIAPERRHPVFVYVDEFQDYLHLPLDLADALAQARGLGVGFALAHQYMHQLDPAMRSAVLANAQSRIAFRLPSEDARLLAAGSVLAPEDFQSLGAFQCYAQLVANAARPAVVQRQHPAARRADQRSGSGAGRFARAYGVDRAEVEADVAAALCWSS